MAPEARWAHLKAQAKQPTIGRLADDAMGGIERDNPALNGVLPKDYARPALDKTRLGQLIDMISNNDFRQPSPGPVGHPSATGRGDGGEGAVGGEAFDHLFPARLVDSEVGEIPEGWEVGMFADMVEVLRETENPLESPDAVFRHCSIPAYDEGQWPKHELGRNI